MATPKAFNPIKRPVAGSGASIAVLGTGSIGSRHLRVLRDRLKVAPIAVPVRAERRNALETDGFKVGRSVADAAANGAGSVIIATNTGRHLKDLRDAVEANCAALVEKPLSANALELGSIASLAEQKNCPIYVACDLRFDRSLLLFRERLPEIGNVHAVRIECQSYLPDWRPQRDYHDSYSARGEEGGVLLDLIHEIDYAVWLFGEPTRVFARLCNAGRLGIQAEETADLWWDSPSGASVSIRVDYVTRRTHRTLRAYGEHGEIEWDGVAQTVTISLAVRDVERISAQQQRDDTVADQDAAFLRAAAGGDPGALTTYEQGATAVAICDAARLSAISDCVEAVPDWRRG